MKNNYKYDLNIKTEYFINNYYVEDYEEFSKTAFDIIKEVIKDKYVIQVAQNYNLDRDSYFARDFYNEYSKNYNKTSNVFNKMDKNIIISKNGNAVATQTIGLDEILLEKVISNFSMRENTFCVYAMADKPQKKIKYIDFCEKSYDIYIEYSHLHTTLLIKIRKDLDNVYDIITNYFNKNDKNFEIDR